MYLKIVIYSVLLNLIQCEPLLLKSAKHFKHSKRGAFGGLPTYKVGYDIPVVKHSFIKPLVVEYQTKSVPIGVKIPFKPIHRHPTGPGYGFKVPGWSKPLIIPTPTVNVVKPFIPVAPVPTTPVAPVVPAPPLPLEPPQVISNTVPTLHAFPQQLPHFDVKPFAQPTYIPLPQPTPVFQAAAPEPAFPVSQPFFQYLIRPGTATQHSVFATFPKFPIAPQLQFQPTLNPVHIGRPEVQSQFYFPQPQLVSEHHHDGVHFHTGVVQPEAPPHEHSDGHQHYESFPPNDHHHHHQIPVYENNGEQNLQFPQQFNQEHQAQFEQDQHHQIQGQYEHQQDWNGQQAQQEHIPHQEYGPPQQEYGVPYHQERSDNDRESRSLEDSSEEGVIKYHNLIPLEQQLPMKRPSKEWN